LLPDPHAHLDLIEEEPGAVVERARAAGVAPLITIGINVDSSEYAVALAERLEGVYASVGIHPNDASTAGRGDVERLRRLAVAGDRVAAVGETGLDYYRDRSSPSVQKGFFRAQVALAAELDKALIVHDRQAHDDVLDLLESEAGPGLTVVMHCFSGDRSVLDECLRRGYYVSFAGPVTFRKNEETRRLAALVPPDRILAETDAPFLSPEPFRGKPNVPERVRLVAAALAEARGVTAPEMEAQLAGNTRSAFGFPDEKGAD